MGETNKLVSKAYKTIKKSVQEKREDFKHKFEVTKVDMLEEIMIAKTPEELIKTGEKIQEKGEELKAQEDVLKNEEKISQEKKDNIEEDESNGVPKKIVDKLKESSDEEKALKEAEKERLLIAQKEAEAERIRIAQEEAKKEQMRIAQEQKLKEEERLALLKLAEIRSKMSYRGAEARVAPIDADKFEIKSIKLGMAEGEKVEANKFKNENLGAVNKPVQASASAVATQSGSIGKVENSSPDKKLDDSGSLTSSEVRAIAKNIAKSEDGAEMLIFLENFRDKEEIIAQPEVIEAFKRNLAEGMHLYDIDRLVNIPNISMEVFDDLSVQKGIQSSLKSFVLRQQNDTDWESISGAIDRVVKGAKISDIGLRSVAEEIKINPEAYQLFVGHFGLKRLYPDSNQ